MLHLNSSAAAAAWLKAQGAQALRTDHRKVRPGDAFLAWPGRSHDARLHASSALAAGAAACLLEAQGLTLGVNPGSNAGAGPAVNAVDARLACLNDLKRQSGAVADEFWGHPSRELEVVAVTGTNGKTSTTWWLAQALGHLGRRCGVVGTLGVGEPQAEFEPTGLTTPDAVALQEAFRRFADSGLAACAIEASSIGIVEHRLGGASLAVAAFTNLTQDHLDYHGTMAAYGAAKRELFDAPGLRAAVLNVDDAQGRAWAAELGTRAGLALWTVSASGAAECAVDPHLRLWARQVQHTAHGMALTLCERESPQGPERQETVHTRLIGAFNVENLVVVAGCLRALGLPLALVAQALAHLTPVPGRLERVTATVAKTDVATHDQPVVLVDYAHTPDALDKALQTLAPLAAARGGQLWCVFGCGGDRDATKRPLMGRVAVQGAAHVVVTSDNPRSEPPARIVDQVMAGARETAAASAGARTLQALEDRRAAIAHAVRHAAGSDVVLIAGKGHEQTQEIGGLKLPFSDVAEAQAALRARAAIQASGQRDAPSLTGRDARKGVPLPPATSVGEPKA